MGLRFKLLMIPTLAAACALALPAAESAAPSQGYEYYLTGQPDDVKPKIGGGLVLLGGGGSVDEATEWLVRRSGGGNFVIIRASGGNDFHASVEKAGKVQSIETFVFRDRRASGDPKVKEALARADALYIAGGDQWNYVRYWRQSPVSDAIHTLAQRGVPIAGTSAGLAILGQYYFAAERGTIRSEAALKNPFDRAVTVGRDFLSFPELKGIITDSHFSARDRMGRLIVFLSRIIRDGWESEAKGIGVDERTAVLVESGGRARVVGHGNAYFVRLSGKPELCEPGQPLSVRQVQVERVTPGGVFYLNKWRGGGGEYTISVQQGVLQSSRPGGAVY